MRSRYVVTNGIRLFCLEAGPADGPLVLLLHGFPEIAYSWRYQCSALGEAGYHVVAPDLPGYGRSDKPDVTYDCDWINACLVGVVDAYGADRFVIAGHDWGGLLVWIMARQYPERIAGVIGVNTPDLPRSPMPPVELMFKVLETPIYIMQFQERGVAEWVLGTWGRGIDDFVELIFGMTTQSADAFPPAVLDVYKDAFRPVGRAHAADRVLPEPRPQLGAHDRDCGSHDRRPVLDDLGGRRSGAYAHDDRGDGRARAELGAGRHRQLRTLDATRAA